MTKRKIIIPDGYYISKQEIIENMSEDSDTPTLIKYYKLDKFKIADVLLMINEHPLSENTIEAFKFLDLESKITSVIKSFDRTVQYAQDIAIPFIESNAVPHTNPDKSKIIRELKGTIDTLNKAKAYIKAFLNEIPPSTTLKAHKDKFNISNNSIHIERIRRLLFPFALYCYKNGLEKPSHIAEVFVACINCVLPRGSLRIIDQRYALLLIENNKVMEYVQDVVALNEQYSHLPEEERSVMVDFSIMQKYDLKTLIKTAAPPRSKLS